MKLETKKAFAAYIDYGNGRVRVGDFYPIASAADAAFKHSSERNYYYRGADSQTLLVIDDNLYVLTEDPIPRKDRVKNDCLAELKMQTCLMEKESAPQSWSHNYDYGFFDEKSAYEYILFGQGKFGKPVKLQACIAIKDEEFIYILKSDQPVILEKIIVSRDLAIAEALGKLTDEEKSLLGLK